MNGAINCAKSPAPAATLAALALVLPLLRVVRVDVVEGAAAGAASTSSTKSERQRGHLGTWPGKGAGAYVCRLHAWQKYVMLAIAAVCRSVRWVRVEAEQRGWRVCARTRTRTGVGLRPWRGGRMRLCGVAEGTGHGQAESARVRANG